MTERNYHNLHNMRIATNTAPLLSSHGQHSDMLVRTDARPGPESCSSAGGLLGGRRAFPSAVKKRAAIAASDRCYKTKATVENFKKRNLDPHNPKEEEDDAAMRKKRRLSNDDKSSQSSPKSRAVRFDSPPQKAVQAPPSPRQANQRRRRYQRRNSKVSHMFFTAESLGLDQEERKTIENDYNNKNGNGASGAVTSPSSSSPPSTPTPAMSSSLLSIYRRYGLSPPPSCGAAPISPDAPLKPTAPPLTSQETLLSSQSELLRRMMEAQRERAIQRKGHLDAARALLLQNASAMSFLRRAHIAGGAVNQGTMNNSLDDAGRQWPR